MDNAPSKIKEGVAKEEADQVKSQLEEAAGSSVSAEARGGVSRWPWPTRVWPLALRPTRRTGRPAEGLIAWPAVKGLLSAVAGVVAAVAMAAPAGAAIVGQGGVRMGADVLWSEGVLGQGQTVAILDEGFAGLDRSIALGELPPRDALTIRAFDPLGGEGGFTEFGIPTQHGVRMAELVHDLALPGPPGARRLPHARPVRGGGRLDHGPGHRSSATPTPS